MRAALAFVVAIAIGWLYAGVLTGLGTQWVSSPDASYGAVLAGMAIVVAWRRRGVFIQAADPTATATPGAALLVGGLGLYLVGLLAADVFLTRVSFVVVVAGALWFLAGRRAVRTVAAPLAFLLIAVPLPDLLVNAITLPLQLNASRIAEATLALAGVPVFRDGNLLELPSITLQVAEACSGLRSIVSLAAISLLLAWSEPSWPRRAAIVVSSLPVAIVMNGFRIAATGVACEAWGPRAASGSWHTFSGWVTFLVSVVVLVQLQRVFARARTNRLAWSPRATGAMGA
jgi:exosortase